MNRALVLVGCLAAAGAVAAYTKQAADSSEHGEVFTVHVPAPSPAPPPSPAPVTRTATDIPSDRVALIRELQRELKRVGCYSGDANGVWTTSSRLAMKSFTDKVNASLPIDNPDEVLLSLVRGHKDTACAAACPPGQAPNDKGRCLVVAKSEQAPADRGSPPVQTDPVEKSSPSAAPAAAATAALAGSALVAAAPNHAVAEKASPKPGPAEGKSRMAAAVADEDPPSTRSDRPSRAGGPTPPERVYTRRTRRYSSNPRPPRFVRNVLRTFGFR